MKRDDDGAVYCLVCVDIDGKDKWLLMHQVVPADFEKWKLRLATSGRGDPRVLPLDVVHGKPFRSELEATKMWLREKPPFYTYQGPPALPEWFDALSASGRSLIQHRQNFVKRSGIVERGGVAREHSVHTEVLTIAMTQDQLQLSQLASFEYIVRRMVMIETAVSRDARSPDWDGLDMMLSTTLADAGAVDATKFSSWIAGVQKDQAVVFKQGRLLREEQETRKKKGVPKARPADAPP